MQKSRVSASNRRKKNKGIENPERALTLNSRRGTVHYDYIWNNATASPGFYDWVMKGNGLYDPDVAIGGNSATGLDNWAAIYRYYCVQGSTCDVTVKSYADDDIFQCVIIPSESSNAFAYSDVISLLHAPDASKVLNASIADGVKTTYHGLVKTSYITNCKDADDQGFQAATNADPVHLWYWHIVSFNDHSAHTIQATMQLHIAYDVIFSGPKQLSA